MKKPPSLEAMIKSLHTDYGVVGRDQELLLLGHCIFTEKNVLLEGPVGVGKTFLVSSLANKVGRTVIRIDGDSRYTEQKLTGWFDPPSVLKHGYSKKTFMDGPLKTAMENGAILFINELNRMPEAVQNILLPALDEKKIEIPKIGTIAAKTGFHVLATQNPKEFVATSHLSEALLDRFELVLLDYQSEAEEREILNRHARANKKEKFKDPLEWSLHLVRETRTSTLYKRGASIRAALSIFDLCTSLGGSWDAFLSAAAIALPTRVELSDEGLEKSAKVSIEESVEAIKKKSSSAPLRNK